MTRRNTEFQQRHQKQTQEADTTYPARLDQIRLRRDDGLKKAEEHYPPRIAALKEKYESDRRQIDEDYRQTKETTQKQYTTAWNNLIKNWTEGMARVNQIVEDVREEGERRFLDWTRPELDGWKPPTEVPPGMRFGAFEVDLDHFPNGVPRDPRLEIGADPLPVPGTPAVSDPGLAPDQGGRSGQGRRDHFAAIVDAPLSHLGTGGQGPLHHRRPRRLGREFRRVHAPGRLSRASGHQPDLDRGASTSSKGSPI